MAIIFFAMEQSDLDDLKQTYNVHIRKVLTQRSLFNAILSKDGLISLRDSSTGTYRKINYLELVEEVAEAIGADLKDPSIKGRICTCPTTCDCQDYEKGLVSNECPIHNEHPLANPDCPQHGWNGRD